MSLNKWDAGNTDRNDNAFVFSDRIKTRRIDDDYALQLASVISHELSHLLGASHHQDSHDSKPIESKGPLDDVAFAITTHVESAKDVRADLIEDGKVTIDGREYAIHPRIVDAITRFPDHYFAGTVGPDGFPDVVVGQQVIHAVDNAFWLQRVLDMAWLVQDSDEYSEAEKSQSLAFAYGYTMHSTGGHLGTFDGE